VYGHSEDAVIVAELAKKNKNINHLGFWPENGLNNFHDFSLFNRIKISKRIIESLELFKRKCTK